MATLEEKVRMAMRLESQEKMEESLSDPESSPVMEDLKKRNENSKKNGFLLEEKNIQGNSQKMVHSAPGSPVRVDILSVNSNPSIPSPSVARQLNASPVRPSEHELKLKRNTTVGGSRLYERAMQAKLDQQRKREELIKNENTFSPTLISSRKLRNRSTTPGRPRHEALYEHATSSRRSEDPPRELEECTFAPKTNKNKKLQRGLSPARRSEALYNDAKLLEEKRKAKAAALREEQKKHFTFKPKITAKARGIRPASPNVSARVSELQRNHLEKSKRFEAERDARATAGCTFTPKINERPLTPGSPHAPIGSVQDRLAMYQKQLEKKHEELRQKALEEEKKQLTFQPNINRRGSSATAPPPEAVHSRLYAEGQARSTNVEKDTKNVNQVKSNPESVRRLSAPRAIVQKNDQDDANELAECTFTPNTKKVKGKENGDAQDNTERGSEKVWNRLYKEKQGLFEKRDNLKAEQELNDCSFKPTIHRSSIPSNKQGKTSTPIWDRLNQQSKSKKIEDLEKAKEDMELASCTFQPRVSGTSNKATENGQPKSATPIWDRLASTNTISSGRRASAGSFSTPKRTGDEENRKISTPGAVLQSRNSEIKKKPLTENPIPEKKADADTPSYLQRVMASANKGTPQSSISKKKDESITAGRSEQLLSPEPQNAEKEEYLETTQTSVETNNASTDQLTATNVAKDSIQEKDRASSSLPGGSGDYSQLQSRIQQIMEQGIEEDF